MKKFLVIITLLVILVSNVNAFANHPNNKHRHHKCKGWGKAMMKPKHNWKSYVRYH